MASSWVENPNAQTPNEAHCFRFEDDNVSYMHVRPHCYQARQVKPNQWIDEVTGRSSWGIEYQYSVLQSLHMVIHILAIDLSIISMLIDIYSIASLPLVNLTDESV